MINCNDPNTLRMLIMRLVVGNNAANIGWPNTIATINPTTTCSLILLSPFEETHRATHHRLMIKTTHLA